MSRYHFAPRPLSGRASTGRYHAGVEGFTTPFEAANLFVTRPPLRDELQAKGEASNALLSLTGVSGGRPTQLRAGATAKTTLEDMNPSPDRLKETNKRKREDANKFRRREQCRANQARYRDKQKNAQLQLEQSVEQLPRSLPTTRDQFPLAVARGQHSGDEEPRETRQILAILERSFAHDAAMGELRGVKALVEQLLLFSQYFGTPHLKLQRIESVAPGVMAARAKLSMTVTEFTLRHAFPHLEEPASEDRGDGRGLLYQRLLGQRLECNCSLTFLFDEDSDRVVRLETSIDLTTPLLELLGSLKDVSKVLEHARISSECVIGVGE
ncbi:hypothetical protein GQ600_1332 [Phytophthora cactorum]|nr:hypothetical protein GQ600_1332 [Phytophthora cactorum]